ncbi:MAG: hypothetical protein EA425_01370 [Puniceicoccaceae bacterium]|nr:MAG: hypothetical protein EA425_01370 [Puniceicoccaceae bacterium]
MRRFVFRLESVLTLRARDEEAARQAFTTAHRQEAKFLDELKVLFEAKTEHLKRMFEIRSSGSTAAAEAGALAGLREQERRLATVYANFQTARRIREQKGRLLIEARKRRRILERLREKQAAAHAERDRRLEEKALEEAGARSRHNVLFAP